MKKWLFLWSAVLLAALVAVIGFIVWNEVFRHDAVIPLLEYGVSFGESPEDVSQKCKTELRKYRDFTDVSGEIEYIALLKIDGSDASAIFCFSQNKYLVEVEITMEFETRNATIYANREMIDRINNYYKSNKDYYQKEGSDDSPYIVKLGIFDGAASVDYSLKCDDTKLIINCREQK